METKTCTKCNNDKLLIEFNKQKLGKYGVRSNCKLCQSILGDKYRSENKEKLKERQSKHNKKYYENNKEKELERAKKYRENNSEKRKESCKNWAKNNPEKTRKQRNKWVKNNPEKVKQIDKKYRDNPKNKIKIKAFKYKWSKNNIEKIKENRKKQHKNNPHISVWRTILKDCLKRFRKKKEGKTIDLLGYSALDLKNDMISKFTEGMSWDNHGEWHIDHIKRVREFSKDTPPHIVNALSNLQPLWATSRTINGVFYEGNLNRG